jgi:two-component system response regulator YesN
MVKLMIVDDEYLSRFALRTLISKNLSTIEIIAEAENGRQAIELNRKFRPQIIIMDIKMPGISGIDASMEIINEFPETSILILTAYDNFEFIKRALDIGVKGYILKPIKEAEVIDKLSKMLNQIHERESRNDFMETVEKKISIVKPFMEDEMVSAFISGNYDTEKIKNFISFLQEDIQAGYFFLLSSGSSYSAEINNSVRNRVLREKILDILGRHLPLMKKCFFGRAQGNTIVVFIPVEKGLPGGEVIREALMIGQQMQRKLMVIGNIDLAIGIGNVYSDISEFSKSYNEATIALKRALTEKKVIHFSELDPDTLCPNSRGYPIELENKLIEQLKFGNIECAENYSDQIFLILLENNKNPEQLKEAVYEFITILKRAVAQIGIHLTNPADTGMLYELMELSCTEEIELWGKNHVHRLILQTKRRNDKNADIFNKIFDYTNRNFNKDITLESAASEAGLTSQYLSKIFKEKCGVNFIDYITEKRMEYAKELLKNSRDNIRKISKMAGYEDANYFCRIFKKGHGISPKQYRLKMNIGE